MTSLAPTICAVLGIRPPMRCEARLLTEVFTTLKRKERVCLVIIDSFGLALWRQHHDRTPTFNALARDHCLILRAESPPYSPVNLATIATGLSFESHRVRRNSDPIDHETILDVMKRCSLKTALAARRNSSLAALLAARSALSCLAHENRDDSVIDLALAVMKEQRPDFLWIHLLYLDKTAHQFGPESRESGTALAHIDRWLSDLAVLWNRYHYSALILGDHGHHQSHDPHGEIKGIHDGSDESDFPVPLTWSAAT